MTLRHASTELGASAQGPIPSDKKELSPESLRRFHDMVDDYPNKRSMLMMTLRLIEEEFGCIDDAGMQIAADLCGVHASHVLGMVTFYTHFKRPAHGKHRFMVCATLMCALDGNTDQALKQIKDKIGIGPGEITRDGIFSCEKVECLADCDKPPVVQKDFEHFCSMKGKALDEYLDALLKKEGKTPQDYAPLLSHPIGGDKRGAATMDLRVPVLPSQYNFVGEATRTTAVPPALHTPLSAPVKDGVDMNGAKHG